jgi:hypothetical protein
MYWVPVMRLPDGTTIETPMPSPGGTDQPDDVNGYRVCGPSGITMFATPLEATDHLMHLPDSAWRERKV